jgi:hypothetical protein
LSFLLSVPFIFQTTFPSILHIFFFLFFSSLSLSQFLVQVLLDNRAVVTPTKQKMIVPTSSLAHAIAMEWDMQIDEVKHQSMLLVGQRKKKRNPKRERKENQQRRSQSNKKEKSGERSQTKPNLLTLLNFFFFSFFSQATLAATALDDVANDSLKYMRETLKYIETDAVWSVLFPSLQQNKTKRRKKNRDKKKSRKVKKINLGFLFPFDFFFFQHSSQRTGGSCCAAKGTLGPSHQIRRKEIRESTGCNGRTRSV